MNLLERVLTLLRANLNTMAEKSDDPEKMLRQLQLDMRNQLVQVKTQVATVIAEVMKLQKRNSERQAETNAWFKKAELAIQQNNESAARDFLSHYNDLNRQAQRYQQQQKEQEQLATTMRGILRQLEAKIAEVDTTIELLAARKRTALLQQRVYDTLSKSASPKDKERANKAQDALLDIEARARALAELQQQDLSTQLAQLSQEQLIDEQLQQLKDRQRATPLLPAGNPHAAELIPPVPTQSEPARKRTNQPATADALIPLRHTDEGSQPDLDLEKLKRLMDK
ncbi:MAG: PspA/IM30 family protein [Ktedonobacteraceae bacterium]